MNVTKLWMHDPAAMTALFELIVPIGRGAGLTIPERAVATIIGTALSGDTYCPSPGATSSPRRPPLRSRPRFCLA